MINTIGKTNMIGFILVALLTGCTGMKMDPPDEPGVTIEPISAELVQKMATDRERQRAQKVTSNKLDSQRYQYLIQARDVLSITVWDHPELTIPAGQFRGAEEAGHLVSEKGTIFYPHIGTVKVAGKTMVEVGYMLSEKLNYFIQNPQIDVRVAGYRSQYAFVVGQTKTPGEVPINDVPLTVVRALSLAGGVTPEASLANATLTRGDKLIPIDILAILQDGDISMNMTLKTGDVLHIPNENFRKIYVMGETFKQDPVIIPQNRRFISLSEALSEVGGIDQITSNPELLYVVRGNPNNPNVRQIFHLDASSPDALILAEHFQLKPRDLVYVGTAGVTRWSRVISQLLPSSLVSLGRIGATGF